MDLPRYRCATKDLAGRCCRCCLKGIRKGEEYRRSGTTAMGRALYEHRWCGYMAGLAPQLARSPGTRQRAAERPSCSIVDAAGKRHTGTGANFTGMVAEWEWLEPAHAPYALHLGSLAWCRHRMAELTSPELNGAATMVVSRLAHGRVDSDRLWDEATEAEAEFALPRGLLVYFLAAVGVATLSAERMKKTDPEDGPTISDLFNDQ